MFSKKFFDFLLVLVCLGIFAGGMYYYLSVTGKFKPAEDPGVSNAVVIVTTAPFQPLVVYPGGKKTGFDPATGTQVIQIPRSKYYFEAGEQTPEPGSFWLGLTDTPDTFTLQVSGEKGEYYSFGFYSFRKGIQQTQTFSGQFTSGNIVTYEITSAPNQSFPWYLKLRE